MDRKTNMGEASARPEENSPAEGNFRTEREQERREEDREYVPVIVKRSDEALRHPDDVLENAIAEGLEQLRRPFISLALSSIAAGLILGFSAMSVAIMESGISLLEAPILNRLTTGLVYPLGFVLCIMSGTQLFTEHTATAVYPVLDRRAGPWLLLRLWAVVLAFNLLGALASAGLLTLADDVVRARDGYLIIARHLLGFDPGSVLVSAILAGWLMALGAWLVLATPPRVSQIVSIYIVTFIIGFGDLHHSIAGSVEIFTALFMGNFSMLSALKFIGLAVIGNLIGGSVFVALLNYGHIRKTQKTPD